MNLKLYLQGLQAKHPTIGQLINIIGRYGLWVAIAVYGIAKLNPIPEEVRLFRHIALGLACLFVGSSFMLFAYTKIKFKYAVDINHPLSFTDYVRFAGMVIISCAIVIGLIYLGGFQSLWNSAGTVELK